MYTLYICVCVLYKIFLTTSITWETHIWASQAVLMVKNPPANARDIRDSGSIPELGRFPEEGMATHSSIIARRIPWTEKPEWAAVHGVAKSHTGLSIPYI